MAGSGQGLGLALLVVSCGSWTGCRPPQESEPTSQQQSATDRVSLDNRIGWVQGSCLAIANPMLAPGSAVEIATGDTSAVVEAQVASATSSDRICPALLEDRRAQNTGSGWSFYELRVPADARVDLGIAVVGGARRTGQRLDVTGDGMPDTFTQCSTAEGIRFDVWSGMPYQGTPLWSAYYYLGYDTKATCPVP